jgi:hypothetical protein
MAVDNTKVIDEVITSYELKPKEKRTINVCTTVTEDDDSGLNGKSDVGSDCVAVEISCKLAKTGPIDTSIVTPLCQGNKHDPVTGACKRFNGETSTAFHISVSDEDWDSVPNEEDATPAPEDEACRGQEGRAVLLFLDFGSSDLNDLVGAVGVGVDRLTDDYDFVAIATDPVNVAGFTIDEDTLANADMVVDPTLAGVMAAYRAATSRGFDITTYVASHGGADALGNGFITSADSSGQIDEASLDAALSPTASGTCAFPFRATSSLACYFSELEDVWLRHGAKVADGRRFGNFYPQELNGLGDSWNGGATFGASVASSPDAVVRGLNGAAVAGVGVVYGCGDVLGLLTGPSQCSQDFFTTKGPTSMSFALNGRGDYDPSLNGQDNMTAGSQDVILGDPSIDKFTPLTW